MLAQINNYWRHQKGYFQDLETFRATGIYRFYEKVFGPLVFTEDLSRPFVTMDHAGNFFDEIYYPIEIEKRKGILIPKIFLESDFKPAMPALAWQSVAQNGYAVLDNIKIDQTLYGQALNEAFIPFGINPALDMSKTVQHAFFGTQADYDNPERHKSPEYMNEITAQCLKQFPIGNFHVNHPLFHTADIVRYLYDQNEIHNTHGPYTFHMDFFSRLHYMFFIYFSKKSPIEGRELLVGKRNDFESFSVHSIDPTDAKAAGCHYAFDKVPDDKMSGFDTITIKHGTVVLMNTLNPMMMHKVNKLRHDNEVVLMTNYCWSKAF